MFAKLCHFHDTKTKYIKMDYFTTNLHLWLSGVPKLNIAISIYTFWMGAQSIFAMIRAQNAHKLSERYVEVVALWEPNRVVQKLRVDWTSLDGTPRRHRWHVISKPSSININWTVVKTMPLKDKTYIGKRACSQRSRWDHELTQAQQIFRCHTHSCIQGVESRQLLQFPAEIRIRQTHELQVGDHHGDPGNFCEERMARVHAVEQWSQRPTSEPLPAHQDGMFVRVPPG